MEQCRPRFGGPKKIPAYYSIVTGIIETLREKSTLQTISDHLNASHLTTPSNKEWSKRRVSEYIRYYITNKAKEQ